MKTAVNYNLGKNKIPPLLHFASAAVSQLFRNDHEINADCGIKELKRDPSVCFSRRKNPSQQQQLPCSIPGPVSR